MKVKFYLTRPESKNETVIFARVSYEGITVKVYIGENINPKHWNAKTHSARNTPKFPEFPEFNQRLDNIKSAINKAFINYQNEYGEVAKPTTLKNILDITLGRKKEIKLSFLEYFVDFVKRQKEGLRINPKSGKPITVGTAKHYQHTYNSITEYAAKGSHPLEWENIDIAFYNSYTKYITGQKMALNTIGAHIKRLKVVLNEATAQGFAVHPDFKSKYFSVQREEADNISLSEEELTALEELDLLDNKRLEAVRDLFLIGCHTGLRFSDFSTLSETDIQGDFLHVTQLKTGGKIVIPIHSVVQSIINKYDGVLPKPISNQKNNDYLKEIGQMVDSLKTKTSKETTKGGVKIAVTLLRWEMLSTHTARRTFATLQYLKGVPSITIMAITGHKTEKDFLKYIKVSPIEHAEKMKELWAVDSRKKMKAV